MKPFLSTLTLVEATQTILQTLKKLKQQKKQNGYAKLETTHKLFCLEERY